MDNHEEETGSKLCYAQGTPRFAYQQTAIRIVHEIGDRCETLEFATKEDYALYVSLANNSGGKDVILKDLKSHGQIYQEIKSAIKQMINS